MTISLIAYVYMLKYDWIDFLEGIGVFVKGSDYIRNFVKRGDYIIHFWYMRKDDLISIMKNSDLNEKKKGLL